MSEQDKQHSGLRVLVYALLRSKSIADNQSQLKTMSYIENAHTSSFYWEHTIYCLFCVKQLSSNFQPQYRGKTKQLRGLEQAEVAYK